jgi:hypothetical protein
VGLLRLSINEHAHHMATSRREPVFGPGKDDRQPGRRSGQDPFVTMDSLERPLSGFNKILPGIQARNGLTRADRDVTRRFRARGCSQRLLSLMSLPGLHLRERLKVEVPRSQSSIAGAACKEGSSAMHGAAATACKPAWDWPRGTSGSAHRGQTRHIGVRRITLNIPNNAISLFDIDCEQLPVRQNR